MEDGLTGNQVKEREEMNFYWSRIQTWKHHSPVVEDVL